MNKLSLMGSCQQVVMINLIRTIKSHVKKTFRQFQYSHRTVPFTFVLYSKIRAFVFSKQFWVVDAPFERSSPSRLQFSQRISQRFMAPSGHVMIQDSPWLFICPHLWKIQKTPRTTEPCCLYGVKNCYNNFFGALQLDTRPIVRPKFRTHFTDILNSQLMYTVQLVMIKGGLTLILLFPKAWFLSRIRRSNFRCFLHRAFQGPQFWPSAS